MWLFIPAAAYVSTDLRGGGSMNVDGRKGEECNLFYYLEKMGILFLFNFFSEFVNFALNFGGLLFRHESEK